MLHTTYIFLFYLRRAFKIARSQSYKWLFILGPPKVPLVRNRSTDRKVDIRTIFRPNSMSLHGLWELPHFFEVFIRIMRTTSRKNREKIGKRSKKIIFLIIAYHGGFRHHPPSSSSMAFLPFMVLIAEDMFCRCLRSFWYHV